MDLASKPQSSDATAAATAQPETGLQGLETGRILSAYKQMLLSLFIGTLSIIFVLFLMVLPFFYKYFLLGQTTAKEPSIFLLVALSGCLGAFMSALTRLYNLQELPRALISPELRGLRSLHMVVYSLVPSTIGAISATVLYFVFAGKLLDGAMFPQFVCKSPDHLCDSFTKLVGFWGPNDAPDFAKALIWGFIAGFAERFVPNTLGNLAKSAKE